jgi:hypothetical protein
MKPKEKAAEKQKANDAELDPQSDNFNLERLMCPDNGMLKVRRETDEDGEELLFVEAVILDVELDEVRLDFSEPEMVTIDCSELDYIVLSGSHIVQILEMIELRHRIKEA